MIDYEEPLAPDAPLKEQRREDLRCERPARGDGRDQPDLDLAPAQPLYKQREHGQGRSQAPAETPRGLAQRVAGGIDLFITG